MSDRYTRRLSDGESVCRTCGSLVSNQLAHELFHDRIDRLGAGQPWMAMFDASITATDWQAAHDAGEDEEMRVPEPHLPECYAVTHRDRGDDRCICPALRACEERSYTLGIEVGKHDGWVAGYAAGVAAARDAVAAVPWFDRFALGRRFCAEALAAIDALTQEDK